jgi:hypothetical protein
MSNVSLNVNVKGPLLNVNEREMRHEIEEWKYVQHGTGKIALVVCGHHIPTLSYSIFRTSFCLKWNKEKQDEDKDGHVQNVLDARGVLN